MIRSVSRTTTIIHTTQPRAHYFGFLDKVYTLLIQKPASNLFSLCSCLPYHPLNEFFALGFLAKTNAK